MPSFRYDAFISHAVEDKLSVANELCAKLEQKGLKIWYSGYELRPGDSITERIEEGLKASRYGVVIFTPTYVSKVWALREFFALLELEKLGRKKILPILHGIKATDLAARGLEIEDRFMISTDRGMDYVVDRLALQVKEPSLNIARRHNNKVTSAISLAVAIVLLIGFYWIASDYRITKKSQPLQENHRILTSMPDDKHNRTLVIRALIPGEQHRVVQSLHSIYPALKNLIDRHDVVVEYQMTIRFNQDMDESVRRAIHNLSQVKAAEFVLEDNQQGRMVLMSVSEPFPDISHPGDSAQETHRFPMHETAAVRAR